MHELAITQSVVNAVQERLGDALVRTVTLEIGALSGVVADSVRFCFELCVDGTPLQGAELDIIESPGAAVCRVCGAEFEVDDLLPLCACGSAELSITGGQQLLIKQVEMA